MIVRSYRDLRVWRRAVEMACAAFAASRLLPREERDSLGDQVRRAATSVAANIAEGHSRTHRKEFLQFLAIAHASLTELETHLTIAHRVGYLSRESCVPVFRLADEVSRMLTVMRARLGDARLASSRRSPLDAPRRSTLDARG